MKVDTCVKSHLCVDDKISEGCWLRSRTTGEWHLVLNKKGEGYTQQSKTDHSQSMNYPKAKERIVIYDGYFVNERDISDVYKMYDEIYEPNYTDVQLELLEFKQL